MKSLISGTISSLRRRNNPPQILYKVELLDITWASTPVQCVVEKEIQVEQNREHTYFDLDLDSRMITMNPLGRYLLRVQAVYKDGGEVKIDTAFQEVDIQQQNEVSLWFEL